MARNGSHGNQGFLAITGARVVDGLGGVYENQTVLIEGDTIVAVGQDIPVPSGTTGIDAKGMTVIPGLFDMHGHLYARGGKNITMQIPAYPLLYLAGGITSVRAPGELDPEAAVKCREDQASGRIDGPRVHTAGPYFDHTSSSISWIKGTDDAEQALAMFERWHDRIDMVKVYSRIHEDQFKALVKAAHAVGLPVIGHLGSLTAKKAIELGINGLEHGLFQMSEFRPVDMGYGQVETLDMECLQLRRLIQSIVKNKVVICPTIVVFQYSMDPDFRPAVENWLDYLTIEARATREEMAAKRPEISPDQRATLERAMDKQLRFTKMVHEAGGLVVPGTDPVGPAITPGWGLQRELENFVRAGLTPLETIRAATYDSARAMGVDRERGSISAGKLADLVIVEGDPSRDIRDVSRTRKVVLGGKIYDPAELRKRALGQIA
ncbi:MAG TPA: amidohydrolase family protein [Firmicutes bacterium]|nr:amidohydrolase family protein [Candidatus Fermentithermobacillaceae bacterium]